MADQAMPITDARANLTEVIASVRLLRHCVMLTQSGEPQAAIVPAELGKAIDAAGGPDAALAALREMAAELGDTATEA